VQLSPALAAHVDLMAVRTGTSFSQLCQLALGTIGFVEMRTLLQDADLDEARPEARWLRLKSEAKQALELFSDDHRVSRSRYLGVALAELVRRYQSQGSPVFPGNLVSALSANA
jgi:predicted transcriptional regulator